MSSRSLTRDSGSNYLVKFFEDGEILVVNKCRIFREGRLKVGDISKIQWGRNSGESAEGEIIDIGDYAELMKKKKLSEMTRVTENSNLKDSNSKRKKCSAKKPVARDSKEKQNDVEQPAKRLKSGKQAAKMILISEPQWQRDAVQDLGERSPQTQVLSQKETASSAQNSSPPHPERTESSCQASPSSSSSFPSHLGGCSQSSGSTANLNHGATDSSASPTTSSCDVFNTEADAGNETEPQLSTPSFNATETYTAFPFPQVQASDSIQPNSQASISSAAISTPNVLRQALSLLNSTDLDDLPCTDSPQQGSSSNMPRQLFEGDVPFMDMFPSPNASDRRISQAWDRKLDAINKRLAAVSRQQNEMVRMLTYIVQRLNYTDNAQTATATTVPQEQTHQHPAQPAVSEMTAPSMLSLDNVSSLDENFSDIPAHCRISSDKLMKMKKESQSIGNFAAMLTMRLFPELFTSDNLRFKYNYNGVRYQKEPLDQQRRSYLQRYILFFCPHLSEQKNYNTHVIDPVNEILRRKNLKLKTSL